MYSVRIQILVLLSIGLSHGALGISCTELIARIFPQTAWSTLVTAKADVPELAQFYSKEVLDRAARAMLAAKEAFPRDADLSPASRLQPFLDIESAVSDIAEGKMFDAEQFVRQVGAWKKKEEILPYLYKKLPLFGNKKNAVVAALRSSETAFKHAFWVESNGTPTLVTLSFEKETHNPKITDWFRLPFQNPAKWMKETAENRKKKMDNSVFALAGFGLTEMPGKPSYLGRGERERYMAIYASNEANMNTPPIEVKHRSFEIDPSRLFSEMREVAKHLDEESAFHVHLAFSVDPKDNETFKKIGAWWKTVNDYNYLKGLEVGMHPGQLTKLPRVDQAPETLAELQDLAKKFFGIGFRVGIYGASPIPGQVLVGMELRDTSKTLSEFEVFTHEVAEGITKKSWEKPAADKGMRLLEDSTSLKNEFTASLMSRGIPVSTIAEMIRVEPLITIPMHSFDRYADRIPGVKDASTEKQIFEISKEQYFDSVRKTAEEYQNLKAKNEAVDDELLRTAIRMSLGDWAKETKPSRYFPFLF